MAPVKITITSSMETMVAVLSTEALLSGDRPLHQALLQAQPPVLATGTKPLP